MLEKFTPEEVEIIKQEVIEEFGLYAKVCKDDILEDARKRILSHFSDGSLDIKYDEYEEEEYLADNVLKSLERVCDIVTGNCKTRTQSGNLQIRADKRHIDLTTRKLYEETLNKLIDALPFRELK